MATSLSEFIQLVKVVGADEAIRALKELGVNTAELGKQTEDAGEKGHKSAGMMDELGDAAKRAVAAHLGWGTVTRLFGEYLQMLQDVVRLQGELADKAANLADESKLFGEQMGFDEPTRVLMLTELGKAGGARSFRDAREFAIAADIAFTKAGLGGLMAGDNFDTAKHIYAYAGARGFTGQESADLMKLLAISGSLRDRESLDTALAKLSATATPSDTSSLGALVSQTLRGSMGLIQQGVPLDTILVNNSRARAASVSEELAAQTIDVLKQVAIAQTDPGFNSLMARQLRERGINPRSATATDRLDAALAILGGMDTRDKFERVRRSLSGERFMRLAEAFGPENIAATAGVVDSIRNASPLDVQLQIERGRSETQFRQAQDEMAQAYEAYNAGVQVFAVSETRKRARARLDAQIASGEVQTLSFTRGAQEELIMLELFREQMDKLAREGADVSKIRETIDNVPLTWRDWITPELWSTTTRRPLGFGQVFGYDDDYLNAIGGAIQDAIRRQSLDRQAALREQRDQQRVNVTNIGTVYQTADPLHEPPPVRDLDD